MCSLVFGEIACNKCPVLLLLLTTIQLELLAKQLHRKSSFARSMERCITDGMQQYSGR